MGKQFIIPEELAQAIVIHMTRPHQELLSLLEGLRNMPEYVPPPAPPDPPPPLKPSRKGEKK